MADVVGREEEMKMILAAWLSSEGNPPDSPLLVGGAGVGKTQVVWECATKICGKELYCQQGSEELTALDLICTMLPSDEHGRKLDITLSKLSTAMVRGGVFFLDSIGKMRKKALALLESVLDHRRYLDASSVLGCNIKAHPEFRFIAATNPEDLEGDQLEEWIRQRLTPKILFGCPERHETERIIQAHHPALSNNGRRLIDCLWRLWGDKNGDKPPSVRACIEIFGYAQKLADSEEMDPSYPFVLEYHGNPAVIKEKHMERAVDAHI